jgi:hypothetical protein
VQPEARIVKKPPTFLPPILIVLAATVLPAFAQGEPEGDEEETSKGGFSVEVGTWIAQPSGLEMEPASINDPRDPFGTRPLAFSDSTKTELYYQLGYELGKEQGRFVAWIYDFNQDDLAMEQATPGVFQFGELLPNQLFAGVNLDGLADAFDAIGDISLNDFKFEYYRTAFDNGRVLGEWFVGWRRVKFDRSLAANYYALVPRLPPLLPPLSPPNPALDPGVDSAGVSSQFDGRGLTAGMQFRIPLVRDRLRLDTGFSFSALRGDMVADYASTTWYYVVPTILGDVLLQPPYAALGEQIPDPVNPANPPVPFASLVQQRSLQTGLSLQGRSTSASIVELDVELRYRAWRGLEVILGFRQTRYDDVAVDLRKKTGISPLGTSDIEVFFVNTSGQTFLLTSPELIFNVEDETEVDRSVTFEGFYLGVGYTF